MPGAVEVELLFIGGRGRPLVRNSDDPLPQLLTAVEQKQELAARRQVGNVDRFQALLDVHEAPVVRALDVVVGLQRLVLRIRCRSPHALPLHAPFSVWQSATRSGGRVYTRSWCQ